MNKLGLLLVLFLAHQALAVVHVVNLNSLSFSPAHITIQQGDTVRWVKTAGFHNVRESGGTPDTVFYSGAPTGSNFTYNFAFNAPLSGVYNYRCDLHFGSGMVGSVTVNAPPPCLEPAQLTILWEADDQVRLNWNAPQIGTYHVYSTADAALATTPPGPGWTLADTVDVAAVGQATTVLTGLSEKLFFVVLQDCTP